MVDLDLMLMRSLEIMWMKILTTLFLSDGQLTKTAINDAVKQALDQEAYLYLEDSGAVDRNNIYSIHIDKPYDEALDIEGFESFARQLIDAQNNFDAIMNNIRDQLTEEGIIRPSGEMVTKTLKDLDKINGTIDAEEKLRSELLGSSEIKSQSISKSLKDSQPKIKILSNNFGHENLEMIWGMF